MNDELSANTAFPGLAIEYSLDQGNNWLPYPIGQKESVKISSHAILGGKVWLRSKSISGDVSRVTTTD